MKKKCAVCLVLFLFVLSGLGYYLYSEEQNSEKILTDEVVIKEFGDIWYVHMDHNGPYTMIAGKADVLREEIKKQGIKTTGPLFITFYNPPSIYKGDELKWAPSYPIDEETEVKPPLQKSKIPKNLSITLIHTGPQDKIREAFNKVQTYIKENQYEKIWPAYEIYHDNPKGIEVIHPVKRKE